MRIQSLISSACNGSTLLLCAVALAIAANGCGGVTGPDGDPWDDVRDFSWPTDKVLSYRVDDLEINSSSYERITCRQSDSLHWTGEHFYRLESVKLDSLSQPDSLGIRSRTRPIFLPLKDTLMTSQWKFTSDLALVAPLEKDHSWICGSSSVKGVIMPWKATILERYSYRKINGEIYSNVIEVEYRPESDSSDEGIRIWTLFYAQGKGMVMELQSFRASKGSNKDAVPQVRTVLVKTEDRPVS